MLNSEIRFQNLKKKLSETVEKNTKLIVKTVVKILSPFCVEIADRAVFSNFELLPFHEGQITS